MPPSKIRKTQQGFTRFSRPTRGTDPATGQQRTGGNPSGLILQDTNGNDWYYWPGTDGTLRFADAATAEATGFNFNTGGSQIGAGIALTGAGVQQLPQGKPDPKQGEKQGEKMGESGQGPGHSGQVPGQPSGQQGPGPKQGQPGIAAPGPKDIKSDDPNKPADDKSKKTEDPNKPITPSPVQERTPSGPGQTPPTTKK